MAKQLYLVFALVLVAWLNAAPAFAWRTSEQRLGDARRELQRLDRDERLAFAAQRCSSAIDAGNVPAAATWCETAGWAANDAHERGRGRDYTALESSALHEAAWFIAVHGVQQRVSRRSRPPLRNVSAGDPAARLRVLAYQLLGDIRCNCNPGDAFGALLQELDLQPDRFTTLRDARTRALDILLNAPHTPERLWAVAAIANTTPLEFVAQRSEEGMIAEARNLADRIAPLIDVAHADTGRDTALVPLLMHAQGVLHMRARDMPAAATVFEAAVAECGARIWPSADICLDMGSNAAMLRAAITAGEGSPEDMRLPPPLRLGNPGYSESDISCAAVLIVDINDRGALTNIRVAYISDQTRCLDYVMRSANAMRYATADQAKPSDRRRDAIINMRVHPF